MQKLFWTDIFNRRIWVHDPLTAANAVLWEGDLQVGGFAFARSGSLVLCSDQGVFLLGLSPTGEPRGDLRLITVVPMADGEMFNDITTDPMGRVFAGTLDRRRQTGTLYRLEKGKSTVAVLEDVRCSNGMTFSMDERYFFHTDSLAYRITRYEYDRATGNIAHPVVYFQSGSADGLPDGLTIDVEDHMWVAFWGAGVVRRLDPKGNVVAEISLPVRQPSSVMFGGPSMDDLYVTSAAQDAEDLATGFDEKGVFLGGPVYRFAAGIRGREEWPADF